MRDVVGWQKRPPVTAPLRYAGEGERGLERLTIGNGEPSVLLLDFDFVPLVLALCVHRLFGFLLGGLHNLSLHLPLLGRGRAHISAARAEAWSYLCALSDANNLLANTSERTDAPAMRPGGVGRYVKPNRACRATYNVLPGDGRPENRSNRACVHRGRSVGPVCVGWQLLARSRHKDQGLSRILADRDVRTGRDVRSGHVCSGRTENALKAWPGREI